MYFLVWTPNINIYLRRSKINIQCGVGELYYTRGGQSVCYELRHSISCMHRLVCKLYRYWPTHAQSSATRQSFKCHTSQSESGYLIALSKNICKAVLDMQNNMQKISRSIWTSTARNELKPRTQVSHISIGDKILRIPCICCFRSTEFAEALSLSYLLLWSRCPNVRG